MADIRRMQIGQVVDFCAAYNKRAEKAERMSKGETKPKKRKATQADIDAFFG